MASLRVSKTSFLVGTRTLALSTGASVSDIRGLQIKGGHSHRRCVQSCNRGQDF